MVKTAAVNSSKKTSKDKLDSGARDAGGEVRLKRGETTVKTLRAEYGEDFAKRYKIDAPLDDSLKMKFEHPAMVKTKKVRFGSVTIKGPVPDAETVKRNVASGQSALKRALAALSKPGIKLPRNKGVPLYRADPENPTILIRELNGREERGTLADGEFITSK